MVNFRETDRGQGTKPEFLSYSPPGEKTTLKLTIVNCPQTGLIGAQAHFGRRLTKEEVDEAIRGLGLEPARETGFLELYRTPDDQPSEGAYLEEITTVGTLVNSVLYLNKLPPEEINALYFAGSPIRQPDGSCVKDTGFLIAKVCGLTHLNPQRDIRNFYLACNAGGRALRRLLNNPNLFGKNVLLVGMEDLTREVRGFDLKKADPLSLQFFSNGAFALLVIPGKNLTYLVGKSIEIEDEKGALPGIEPWRELIKHRQGDLIQMNGNIEFIRLPQPEQGKQLWMDAFTTTKTMLKHIPDLVEEVLDQYTAQYPNKKIRGIIPHHASYGIFKGLQKRVNIPMEWVVTEGNSSGTTTMIAFIRKMKDFAPGDHIMIASFGAGFSFDVFVVEIGKV